MKSEVWIYAIGILLMMVIYVAMKLFTKDRREVSFHFVERVLIFGLTAVLVVIAFIYK